MDLYKRFPTAGVVWFITFRTSNFKVVHLRHVVDYEYNLSNSTLEISQIEKDLEVLLPNDLKSYANCDQNDLQANIELAMLEYDFCWFDISSKQNIMKMGSAAE